jgi:hypothetical protein
MVRLSEICLLKNNLFSNTWILEELYKAGKLPSLNELEQGRKNTKTYNLFAQYLVTGCIKSSIWKDHCKNRYFSSIVNESDEAVTFLILANNWDAWKEQCEKSKDGKAPRVRTLTAKQKFMQQDGRGYSFSMEGREYYNRMFDLIEKDREENSSIFDQQFLNLLNELDGGGKENASKKKKMREKVSEVVCRHAGPNKVQKILAQSPMENYNLQITHTTNMHNSVANDGGTQCVQARNIIGL